MKYSQYDVDKVRNEADIRMIIPGAIESRASQDITCPFCGSEKKFRISRKKGYNNAHCFKCGEGFAGPMEAYAHYNGLDMKKDFLQVLEGTARQCGVIIVPEESRRNKRISELKSETRKTFCEQQLEGSGLTVEDVVDEFAFGSVVDNHDSNT